MIGRRVKQNILYGRINFNRFKNLVLINQKYFYSTFSYAPKINS